MSVEIQQRQLTSSFIPRKQERPYCPGRYDQAGILDMKYLIKGFLKGKQLKVGFQDNIMDARKKLSELIRKRNNKEHKFAFGVIKEFCLDNGIQIDENSEWQIYNRTIESFQLMRRIRIHFGRIFKYKNQDPIPNQKSLELILINYNKRKQKNKETIIRYFILYKIIKDIIIIQNSKWKDQNFQIFGLKIDVTSYKFSLQYMIRT